MSKEEKIFKEFLKRQNKKLTQPRKIILQEIYAVHNHFDVDFLYEKIHKKYKNVSRATIYRTMPLLMEAGLIKQTLRCESKDHYEYTLGNKNHLHLICMKCGKIYEGKSNEIENWINKTAQKYDFEIKKYDLGAKGICAKCRKKAKKDK